MPLKSKLPSTNVLASLQIVKETVCWSELSSKIKSFLSNTNEITSSFQDGSTLYASLNVTIMSERAAEVNLNVRTLVPAVSPSAIVQDHGIGVDDILGERTTSASPKLQSISTVLIRMVSFAVPRLVTITFP